MSARTAKYWMATADRRDGFAMVAVLTVSLLTVWVFGELIPAGPGFGFAVVALVLATILYRQRAEMRLELAGRREPVNLGQESAH